MSYKISVGGEKDREVKTASGKVIMDGKEEDLNLIRIDDRRFHLIRNNRSFNAEVISFSKEEKTFIIKINGQAHSVKVKDRLDELLQQMGMDATASHKVKDIKAPMPGLVLKILVEVGSEIKENDSVLILEAMKMENVIKSIGAGKVKEIKVKEKQAVDKNYVLIIME